MSDRLEVHLRMLTSDDAPWVVEVDRASAALAHRFDWNEEKLAAELDEGLWAGEDRWGWAIIVDGRPGGFALVTGLTNPDADMAIRIAPHLRGRGVGREVLRQLADHHFSACENLTRLTGRTHEHNVPMQRAFNAAGFLMEARYRDSFEMPNGSFASEWGYALTRADWEAGRHRVGNRGWDLHGLAFEIEETVEGPEPRGYLIKFLQEGRRAIARCKVTMDSDTASKIASGAIAKGDVLAVARVALVHDGDAPRGTVQPAETLESDANCQRSSPVPPRVQRRPLGRVPWYESVMSKLRVQCFTVSVDGYGAGPRQDCEYPLGVGGENLHKWFVPTRTFKSLQLKDAPAARGMHGGTEGTTTGTTTGTTGETTTGTTGETTTTGGTTTGTTSTGGTTTETPRTRTPVPNVTKSPMNMCQPGSARYVDATRQLPLPGARYCTTGDWNVREVQTDGASLFWRVIFSDGHVNCQCTRTGAAPGTPTPPSTGMIPTVRVAEAIGSEGGVVTLTDTKGRRVLVPAARLAYVELGGFEVRDDLLAGQGDQHRVGAVEQDAGPRGIGLGGEPAAAYFDGEEWTPQPAPTVTRGLGAAGAGEVFAVGGRGTELVVERWDGFGWEPEEIPEVDIPGGEPGASFNDVLVRSADDVLAVGHISWKDDEERNHQRPVLGRYDGTGWTVRVADHPGSYNAVADDGEGGYYLAEGHWNPTLVHVPADGAGTRQPLADDDYDVTADALATVPGAGAVAVGTAFDKGDPDEPTSHARVYGTGTWY